MKLSELADISLGMILTRIKPSTRYDYNESVAIISMQEMSYCSGTNIGAKPCIMKTSIIPDKKEQYIFTKKDDVIYGLTSLRAMRVTNEYARRLLPSNFALIRIKDVSLISPTYLVWLLNEGQSGKNRMASMIQGTFNVRGVTVANLRDLEISQLPPLVTQDTIGRLYEDVLKRTKLDREIDYKKSEMILNFLKQINKGEK